MRLTQEQQQRIEEVGRKHHLKFILLHGSYATDKVKEGSDLDIALLGEKQVEFEELLDIYSDLAEIFGNHPQRELDIKSLHKADPLFCYQVVKDSQLLYGDRTDFNEFKAYAFSNYFDSQDIFHLENKLIQKFQTYLNQKYGH
ncbi:MAG: nucleotidyltransferase domain-containing protein [Deltaproteobacteria bacterium]|nr:nucleotidyltransferase domain-containing protein [Deltaproteobacteria bacterium]